MFSRSAKVLLLSALSLMPVAAENVPAPHPAEVVRNIAPRQTDNLLSDLLSVANKLGLTACIPQALPLISILPAIPSGLINQDLLTQALSQTTLALSEVCSFSITGDSGDKFTSYLPTLYSWYNANAVTLGSLVSECTSASPLLETVTSYGSCSQVLDAEKSASLTDVSASGDTLSIETDTVLSTGTGTSGAESTATTAATNSGSSASTEASSSVSQGQAPHETGFVLTAAALAGFIGAVAAL